MESEDEPRHEPEEVLELERPVSGPDALYSPLFPVHLPPRAARPAGKRKRILLVDDDRDYLNLAKFVLEDHGYEVVTASDGAQVEEVFFRTAPNLLLTDYNLPHKNAFQIIRAIRERYEGRHARVIVFTGETNKREIRELVRLEVEDFLEKPVDNAHLLESVERALRAPAPRDVEPPRRKPRIREERVPGSEAEAEEEAQQRTITLEKAPPAEKEEWRDQFGFSLDADKGSPGGAVVEDESETEEDRELTEAGLESDSPIIAWVNKVLAGAVAAGGSDIHIEPQEHQIVARLRVDGTLTTVSTLPIAFAGRLSARVKIMARLIVTERRLPQDGRIRATIEGKKYEFRVSTLPSIYGEKVVIRILGHGKIFDKVSQLGMCDHDEKEVSRSLLSPHGMLLVTGPTGSGKTTTLYTMLNVLNKPEVNIVTAEDPVEYQLPGITQVQMHPSIGLTFESVLRSFLRQDPDIMLVGEIRDLETATIAVKASITGHLVLSTLHTNSAAGTVARMVQMGLQSFMIASSVKLIVAQRLVKRLCPKCRAREGFPERWRRFLTEEEVGLLGEVGTPVGCAQCRDTGYKGRMPIFEVMPIVTPEMRTLVLEGRKEDALVKRAVDEGMRPLRRAAIDAVAAGETSLSEAVKVIMSS